MKKKQKSNIDRRRLTEADSRKAGASYLITTGYAEQEKGNDAKNSW